MASFAYSLNFLNPLNTASKIEFMAVNGNANAIRTKRYEYSVEEKIKSEMFFEKITITVVKRKLNRINQTKVFFIRTFIVFVLPAASFSEIYLIRARGRPTVQIVIIKFDKFKTGEIIPIPVVPNKIAKILFLIRLVSKLIPVDPVSTEMALRKFLMNLSSFRFIH